MNIYTTAQTTAGKTLYKYDQNIFQDLGKVFAEYPADPNMVACQVSPRMGTTIRPMAAFIDAIDKFVETISGDESSANGFAITKDGGVVTSFRSDDENVVVRLSKSEFSAVVVDDYGGRKPYVLRVQKKDSSEKKLPSGVLFALLCYMAYSSDGGIPKGYQDTYNDWINKVCDAKDTDDLVDAVQLAEEMKQMLMFSAAYSDAGFFNTDIIVPNPIELKESFETEETYGNVSFIPVKGKEIGLVTASTIEELQSMYHLNRELTEEEQALVPELPKSYTIPDKLIYALELITKSNRFRNFILRGPAGTGKTEWCKILAYSLKLPYLFFGCSTDTEKMDLTMSIIPAETDEEFKVEGIDPSEWSEDPVLSYAEITGELKDDATPADCLAAVVAKATGKNSAFKYVESNLVKGFRNGYVCEVQEPTIMSRPGVLASLNSMFDGCKAVTLVNGETVRRHRDSIVIYTTNTSYEGCVSLNQSALSRMVAIDLNDLSDQAIIERLEKNTGYGNIKALDKMVKVYRACLEKAAQEAITDGSIDMRAMEDWALANSITGAGTIYRNGMNMLISKTSNDPALREEFISCLESQFKPAD